MLQMLPENSNCFKNQITAENRSSNFGSERAQLIFKHFKPNFLILANLLYTGIKRKF